MAVQDILDRTKVSPDKVSAFVQLHIVQAPVLKREVLYKGVVVIMAVAMIEDD